MSNSAEVRASVAKALIWDAGNPSAEMILHLLVKDSDNLVRIEALDSLSQFPSIAIYKIFRNSIFDENEVIQSYAIMGLGEVGSKVAPAETHTILQSLLERQLPDRVELSVLFADS